jgi:hypothetical protein
VVSCTPDAPDFGYTISVSKYKILLTKSWVLIKLVVVINLLTMKVVLQFHSLRERIYLCFMKVFIVRCIKRDKIISGIFGKVTINVVKISNSLFKKFLQNDLIIRDRVSIYL